MVLGPGGESRVWRVGQLATHERDESHSEDTMRVSEALDRIDRLREKLACLGGDEVAENEAGVDTRLFKPVKPYFAENEDEADEETAENEESPGFMPVNTPHN